MLPWLPGPGDPELPEGDAVARFLCPELTREGHWLHVLLVFHRAGIMKNSSASLFINGQHNSTKKVGQVKHNSTKKVGHIKQLVLVFRQRVQLHQRSHSVYFLPTTICLKKINWTLVHLLTNIVIFFRVLNLKHIHIMVFGILL